MVRSLVVGLALVFVTTSCAALAYASSLAEPAGDLTSGRLHTHELDEMAQEGAF